MRWHTSRAYAKTGGGRLTLQVEHAPTTSADSCPWKWSVEGDFRAGDEHVTAGQSRTELGARAAAAREGAKRLRALDQARAAIDAVVARLDAVRP